MISSTTARVDQDVRMRERHPLLALPHVAGLLLIVAGALAIGRPLGWLGILAPIGPALTAALGGRRVRRDDGWRWALAFGLVAAAMIAGGWGLLQLPAVHEVFIVAWPPALLLFLLGTMNYLLVTLSRAWRVLRGRPLDYPWIPDALRRALRLDDEWTGHGNR